MIAPDLNFTATYTPPAANAVNLNFGVTTVGEVDAAALTMLLVKSAPALTVRSVYNSRVSRPFSVESDARWQVADRDELSKNPAWQVSNKQRTEVSKPWSEAEPLFARAVETTGTFDSRKEQSVIPWLPAATANAQAVSERFADLTKTRTSAAILWEAAKASTASYLSGFEQLTPSKTSKRVPWALTEALQNRRTIGFNKAFYAPAWLQIPWQDGRKPPSGREAVYAPPVTPPPGYVPSADLNFMCKCTFPSPQAVMLNFGLYPCPEAGGLTIPNRKVYFIVNEVSLKRISDNEPIHFTSVSTGTDRDSWCWSLSATLPYTELEKIEPTASGPVEVELSINGQLWRFAIEGYTDDEEFARTNITVKGRSLTAYLEDPYAPVRSYKQSAAINSRQFAENELTRAGLVTGYSLDWQLIDPLGWLMPADTWSYSELTPMQVIQNIVQGAGGYVNSHPTDKQLIVKPAYPTPHWEWASATGLLTIPRSFVKRQSLDWLEKPAYNGVYVSGESTGVTAFVKRTGTAGDFQAPMFVNPMISHTSAARNKGVSILSSGGKQASVSLDLPMEQTLGLISPGLMVEVTNGGLGNAPAWRGIVRSSNVSANWGRSLTVNQSLQVERHYGV